MNGITVWVDSRFVEKKVTKKTTKKVTKKKDDAGDANTERFVSFEDLGVTIEDYREDNDKFENAVKSIPGIRLDWGISFIPQ